MLRGFAIVLACAAVAAAARAQIPPQAPVVEWKDMLQFFQPPEKFKGQMGDYRSVMKFDDGTDVKTPADWPKRRAEILKYWQSAMGEWPAALAKPRSKEVAKTRVENFTRYKLELETAPDKFQEAFLHVPDGQGPFPALIVVFYEATSGAGLNPPQVNRTDWGLQFARRGFVTLSLGGAAGGPKTVQPLSWLAYCAMNANTFLRSRPEVDPARVGIIGHSFGGKWALFASCLDGRFACAVWCDPGIVWNEKDANANYWDQWYLGYDAAAAEQRKPGMVTAANPRTGVYKRLVAEGRDLTDLHALMAPRPFLVSAGAQDRPEHWPALNRAIALYKFLGFDSRIAMTMRNQHGPTPESNAQVVAFFEHFLKK